MAACSYAREATIRFTSIAPQGRYPPCHAIAKLSSSPHGKSARTWTFRVPKSENFLTASSLLSCASGECAKVKSSVPGAFRSFRCFLYGARWQSAAPTPLSIFQTRLKIPNRRRPRSLTVAVPRFGERDRLDRPRLASRQSHSPMHLHSHGVRIEMPPSHRHSVVPPHSFRGRAGESRSVKAGLPRRSQSRRRLVTSS